MISSRKTAFILTIFIPPDYTPFMCNIKGISLECQFQNRKIPLGNWKTRGQAGGMRRLTKITGRKEERYRTALGDSKRVRAERA
jgi:hypothetical protein